MAKNPFANAKPPFAKSGMKGKDDKMAKKFPAKKGGMSGDSPKARKALKGGK